MPREFGSFLDRRRFLRLSALAGIVVAGGCGGGEDSAPAPVTTPPAEGGNRKRLDGLAKPKAEAPVTKK